MITLLHGDHVEASRAELNRLRTEAAGRQVRHLDGQSIDMSQLIQSLESSSLFGGETMVIVERLFAKLVRQQKKIEELAAKIRSADSGTMIILWEDKEVGSTIIKSLGDKVTVRLYKLPVLIFQFLDGIRPGQAKPLLILYARLVQKEAPELVFAMAAKRLRILIQIKDGVSPQGISGWQMTRLTSQAKSFTMDKLLYLYQELGALEYRIKTGMSPFPMQQAFEQWIMKV